LGRAGYGDRYIDLRVEDNPDPIAELKRLLNLHRVYSLIDDSEDSFTKGDLKAALGDLKKAIAMIQKNDDVYVDLGIVNLKLGKKKEAISAFKKALRLNPKMKTLIKQLPAAGLMKSNKEIFVELGIL